MATTDMQSLIAETPFPSAETMQCPFPLYAALRAQGPVHRLPSGEYVVTRHEDIAHITRHPEIFSSHHSIFVDGWMKPATLAEHRSSTYKWGIVSSDPPEHTVKRRLAFEMFKPGRLRGREAMVQTYVDELIDAFIDRSSCEFVSEFADVLPAKVILTLFGLPLDYVDRAIAWGRYEGFGTRFASEAAQAAARDAIMDLGAFIADRVRERAESPGEDDLSMLVQRHIEHDGELDLGAIVAEASNLFIGGVITTTHLISSMMMLFIRHPEAQQAARRDRSSLKRAIEEALRYESPVQMGVRLVVEDTELGGVALPAGSLVQIVWGSANHDERVFECPEAFDVERKNVKEHMAFGNGPHFCLGAPLGRMEAMIAFEQIFARMQNLRFAEGRNDFANHHAVIFRGPERLFIEFDAVA